MKKHILSSTIALAYSAGLSLCVATDKPFDEEFNVPVVNKVPIVNPFPENDLSSLKLSSQPALRNSSAEAEVLRLNKDAHTRLFQATIDVQYKELGQLQKIKDISSSYGEYKTQVETQKLSYSTEIDKIEKTIRAYNQYIQEKKIALETPKEGETSKAEHIAYLEGQLSKMNDVEPAKEPTQREKQTKKSIESSLDLLKSDPTQLEQNLEHLRDELRTIDEKSSSIQEQAVREATNTYKTTLQRKLTTPVELAQFGRFFPSGTLVTPGEVRVALIEMGISKSIIHSNTVVEQFLGAALPNLIWPVFSDIPGSNYGFLAELKHRAAEVKAKLEHNFKQNVEGTASLLNLMQLKEIPVALNLQPDELYTHITTKVAKQQPDDKDSLHLKSFLTEELFNEYDDDVKDQLMAHLKPSNTTALLLLSGGIANSPTVIEQISSRTIPAQEAIYIILAPKKGQKEQKPDQAEINLKLLGSLQEITVGRFNILLTDNILTNLADLQTESIQ